MDMFRRLFGQSGDESEDPETTTKPVEMTEENKKVLATLDATPSGTPTELSDAGEEIGVDTIEVDEESDDVVASLADSATRQLPLETVIASRNAHVVFGQSTDVGMVRTNNQDAMLSLYYSSCSVDTHPDFGLFIVADGMGGHHDGEKASAIVVRNVAHHVVNNIFLPMLTNTDGDFDRPPLTESLTEAIQSANAEVIAEVPDGGTTVTAVALVGDLAYFAHVGDSRAYLITKDSMEQMTRDHSLVQRLIELGQLTPEEAQDHPQQNVLYRAIGQSESLEVDALARRLPPNSSLLICSDGLWGVVEEDIILKIIRENPYPQNACDKLVAMANTMGGKDNITAIMLHVPN